MYFSRLSAFITVVVFIGLITLVIIGAANVIGATITHGSGTAHAAGTIASMGPGQNFVLKTADGKLMHFQCTEHCVSAEPHMQRHINEHAHTDVYYLHSAGGTLIAIDVD
jgi:hypothetical protein